MQRKSVKFNSNNLLRNNGCLSPVFSWVEVATRTPLNAQMIDRISRTCKEQFLLFSLKENHLSAHRLIKYMREKNYTEATKLLQEKGSALVFQEVHFQMEKESRWITPL